MQRRKIADIHEGLYAEGWRKGTDFVLQVEDTLIYLGTLLTGQPVEWALETVETEIEETGWDCLTESKDAILIAIAAHVETERQKEGAI